MTEARTTILICDDEPQLRELMKVTLGSAYETLEAADVETSRAHVFTARPDLVLLDIMMPGGSGLEVLRDMRADGELRATPVVVVSAWSDLAASDAALAAGANAFLAKPSIVDQLVTVVEHLLGGRA